MNARLLGHAWWKAAAVITGALLLRHLWVCFHIHPYADDLAYAITGRTHELLPRLATEREIWNGRYFSNILMLRGPLLLPEAWLWPVYRLMPLVWIGLSLLAWRALLKALTTIRALPLWTLSGILLLCYLNAMPDAAEGIYLYTGAATYQLPSALCLFGVALAVKSDGAGLRSWWGWLALYGITTIGSGCNEMHAVLLPLAWAGWAAWRWRRGARWDPRIIVGFVLAVACLTYVISAPGNAVRGASEETPYGHDS